MIERCLPRGQQAIELLLKFLLDQAFGHVRQRPTAQVVQHASVELWLLQRALDRDVDALTLQPG